MEEEVKNEETQEEEKRPIEEEKPLDKMTAPELREIAKEIPGVTGVHAMKKDQLLAIIKEHRGIKDEAPKRKKAKKPVGVTPKQLKEKIAQLKAEKEAARQAQDKKRVDILRRRINRLKKQTRKVALA
ncbi:MAG: Rho termination factor N-terminal domain-containing protein [Deltaproteobacteria bacterium]|nr:Rho termination factor N-terminal domain-containing protein [Deltaproteobacteria bacterium]MBW1927879.1 Rho termination factor N-terminal domain-containing protein [Deltaproteobacteria bacterium]MBW2025795.1 Rho termination factor N-terminal domain-containing protein [Deltaproteobacteria bacterium]MBW2124828.1 Rho termination factor N-terminal domain-containing protein [Deltaproteobacteria bacterium]